MYIANLEELETVSIIAINILKQPKAQDLQNCVNTWAHMTFSENLSQQIISDPHAPGIYKFIAMGKRVPRLRKYSLYNHTDPARKSPAKISGDIKRNKKWTVAPLPMPEEVILYPINGKKRARVRAAPEILSQAAAVIQAQRMKDDAPIQPEEWEGTTIISDELPFICSHGHCSF